jgi:hypothetical protein
MSWCGCTSHHHAFAQPNNDLTSQPHTKFRPRNFAPATAGAITWAAAAATLCCTLPPSHLLTPMPRPRHHSQGCHLSFGATCPARPPCRPDAHHICWRLWQQARWQFKVATATVAICNYFTCLLCDICRFIVFSSRCAGPSHSVPAPSRSFNAISLEVGGSLLVQPCFT